MNDRWIVINNWDKFQHYKDRDPIWIRTYTRLLADDDYLGLTEHRALLLHRLWLEYASSGCRLRLDTASISRRLSLRVTMADLEALNHAGFIHISASKMVRAKDRDRRKTEDCVLPAETAVASYDTAAATARNTNTQPREIAPDLAAQVAKLRGADKHIGAVIATFAGRGLPEAAFRNALEATAEAATAGRVHGTEVAYFVGTLRKMEAEGQYP